MRIRELELFHVQVPLPGTFYPAWIPGYPSTSNNFTLLRVTTSDGRVGHAAGAAFEREREGLGAILGPYLMGMDGTDVASARQRLTELSYLGWRNFWIETAFWDLKAQEAGVPLWKLLGGASPELPVYASTGAHRAPKEAAALGLDLKRRGFSAVKLRAHADSADEDIALVREVRSAVGPDMKIMVDANQGWPVDLFRETPRWTVERAIAFAKAVAPFDVTWIEEPLGMYDYAGYARLKRESPVPIAGGELTSGWDALKVHLENDAIDVYQPDVCFAGGITEGLRVLEAAAAKGRRFSPHTWTNGFGFLANAALAAKAQATPAAALLEYPIDPPGWVPEARDGLLKRAILAEGGKIRLPEKPGLGVEIDEDALARHAERFYHATPAGVAKQVLKAKGLKGTIQTALAKARAKKRR